jgi:hypothetical protein
MYCSIGMYKYVQVCTAINAIFITSLPNSSTPHSHRLPDAMVMICISIIPAIAMPLGAHPLLFLPPQVRQSQSPTTCPCYSRAATHETVSFIAATKTTGLVDGADRTGYAVAVERVAVGGAMAALPSTRHALR